MTFSGWVCVDNDGSTWGAISDSAEAALASGLEAVKAVFGPEDEHCEEDTEAIEQFPRTAVAVRITVECPSPEAARAALRWLTDHLDGREIRETLEALAAAESAGEAAP